MEGENMKELFAFPTDEILQTDEVYLSISLNAQANAFETEANQIQFQNLLKEAKEKICDLYDEKTCETFLDQIKGVRDDTNFWRRISASVVFYVTKTDAYFYRLSVPIDNGVVISNQAYVLPLIANFQYVSYYHLLCLNHDKFRLFNGRGAQLQEIPLPDDAPTDLEKALGEELTGGQLNAADYNGSAGQGMFHGHNEKSNEVQIDQDNYFRVVDKYVFEHYSKPTGLPLVIFALPENISDFEKLSKNPHLDETKVEGSTAQLTTAEIQDKASEVVNEIIDRRYKSLVERFNETTPEYRLEAQYSDLAMASIQGQIETLLIEDHYQVNGTIDENGQYHEGAEINAYVNQLVQNVLKTNGKVYVLETASMPSDTGIAAILRF
ncbi:baeRF6 domain-containing protein [Marinilactibacillus piezotolerans]|uniref:baeRF6 domain-containing protein n=1 Tax=Marinilactibacillus piezotolerans TaxID=258723 RepID=UPI0009AFC53A|nr:hypothetical protein [Marinilactibacillus piezotolerans]